MHEWTRGERIAAWTLLVAIVSCPFLYHALVTAGFLGHAVPQAKVPSVTQAQIPQEDKESYLASLQDSQSELAIAQPNEVSLIS